MKYCHVHRPDHETITHKVSTEHGRENEKRSSLHVSSCAWIKILSAVHHYSQAAFEQTGPSNGKPQTKSMPKPDKIYKQANKKVPPLNLPTSKGQNDNLSIN